LTAVLQAGNNARTQQRQNQQQLPTSREQQMVRSPANTSL
jgi:hypothetical protein